MVVKMHRNIVDETFRFVFALGRLVGACLLRQRRVDDPLPLRAFTRKLAFLGIILMYVLGTLLLIFLALPIPTNGTIRLRLDVYTAYPIVWGVYMIDGFACFVTVNLSMKYLLDESGYTDRCRETALVASPDDPALARWKRITLRIVGIFIAVLSAQVVVTSLAATHTVSAPVDMLRVSYWSSAPVWLAWTGCGVVAALATIHVGYHCVFFCSQCEITRLHLRVFCDMLEEEKAITFAKERIDLCHAEYCRLIAMVHNLDAAFRMSVLWQLSLVTIGSCLLLFMFTQGTTNDWQPTIFVVFTLLTVVFTFCFTAIPAIMLNHQVFMPKPLLRAWYFKYERHCNIYEQSFDENSRHVMGLFMQSVNSEEAGITVASLARLHPNLLLTLASVIMTYFLVIVQFQMASCPQLTSNVTEMCFANGFQTSTK